MNTFSVPTNPSKYHFDWSLPLHKKRRTTTINKPRKGKGKLLLNVLLNSNLSGPFTVCAAVLLADASDVPDIKFIGAKQINGILRHLVASKSVLLHKPGKRGKNGVMPLYRLP